ncbi:ABC transporter permease [Sphingomonas sp. PR090111-T3T-6A]|uniref:ABC transporter permease n=1 Tax=Sphingomonas sp. PR090111-T3T-6A TaxID=685778 RepID=UPI000373D338|nr:ABC transporter permease [Sphingomonas sp. PR090111-T3T-6A]
MRRLISAAWVIARRDYGATVFSRIFLLFLLGPLFPILFALMFSAVGSNSDGPPSRPVVAVATDPTSTGALLAARAKLANRLGDDALPDLVAASGGDARRLLQGRTPYAAALTGSLASPHITLSGGAPASTVDDLSLVLDTARATAALGRSAPPPVALPERRVASSPAENAHDRVALARAGQTALFFLIVLLAGMSLSTFIEEKSNKVIEVLAAAVPVDAIFLGKLAGMLAISLTGVAVWGMMGVGVVLTLFPTLFAHAVVPAVGWPAFVALALIYFVASYLLLSAVFLGLGSQAGSPREIQVLAMPATMIQLLLFAFASAGVAHPEGWVAKAAAIFPWSSPLAMLARAAERPALWPHLLALGWQIMWLVLALRAAAGLFRRAVLKSGGGRRWWSRAARA